MRKPTAHIVGDRTVFTWQPDGWPVGCLTGYVNPAGGFVLEHVITFPGAPPSTLVHMLNAALEEAWTRGYPYVALHIPAAHPRYAGLTALSAECGFTEYATSWWVRHKS